MFFNTGVEKGLPFFFFCPPPSPAHPPLAVGQQAENDEMYFGLIQYKAKEARLCFKGIN